MSTNFPLLY